MNVPEGFKQTEVGVIPQDWGVVKLDSVGLFFKGGNIPKSELKSEGVPCVLYGEIYTKYNYIEQVIYSRTSKEVADNAFELKTGDVLFAGSGETAEDIGKCFTYQGNERAVAGGDIVILRPNSGFDSSYLGYILNSSSSISQKYFMGQGSSVFHIYPNSLKKLKIPLPPTLAEQSAIAAALSDMDALIEGVEKLLEKKRRIKQGAMQELLTGKKRVSGFESQAGFQQTEVGVIPKDWRVTKLSDLSSMKSGKAITSKNIQDKDIYPCLGGNGLRGYTSSYTHDGNFALIGRQGALCGNVQFMSGFFFASEHAVVVTSKEQIDIKLLYYMLLDMNLNQYAESSAQPGLSVAKINELPIAVPPTRAEQTAIAAILSDMDSEIEQLEKQLAKYRQLKTGMMQELLTGKKRLV